MKLKEVKEKELKEKKQRSSFFQRLFYDADEDDTFESQVTSREMDEIPIGDDFERDGDCGEESTFLAF